MNAGNVPAAKPRWSPAAWVTAFLSVLVLTVLLFAPVERVMDVGLDSSNYGSYSFFTAKHFQYGSEVMPMTGPLGFVPYGTTYSGYLYWKRLTLELLTKGVLSALIVWFFTQSVAFPWLRWFWLLPLVIMAPFINDVPYSFAILLAGLCLIRYYHEPGRKPLLICCGVSAYIALLTLFKGTHTSLGVATFGLVAMQALLWRDFRRLAWIGGTYLATLITLLLAAGQNPLNFPAYFRGMLEVSSGYNAAMGVEETRAVFLHGLYTSVALFALIFLCLWPRRHHPAALAGGFLLAGFTFIFWKHGFVRADGHVLIFFQYAYLAAAMILMFFRQAADVPIPLRPRILAGALAMLAIGLGLWADGLQPLARNTWVLQQFPGRLAAAWRQLTSPLQAKAELETQLDDQRDYYQIPHLHKVAHGRRIDFFGWELGYLILNKFNYQPRPVGGGSFSVFTRELQKRNETFLRDPARRPELFLVNLQTIDDRFLPQDDAGTLRMLIENYQPVVSGAGLTLFEAKSPTPSPAPAKWLVTHPVQWNQPVIVPKVDEREMLLATFSLPPNLFGRARGFLYKPPQVMMDLEGSGLGFPNNRRVIPGMFSEPVPFSPVLEDTHDLQNLFQGQAGKLVDSFVLKTDSPGSFDAAGMSVSFYTAPRPEKVPIVPVRLINSRVSRLDPFLVDAFIAPTMRDDTTRMVAQVLVPPARMGFELEGDENHFTFSYGMWPSTYSRGTDGVDIWVELERPGRPPQRLFQRNLSPAYRGEDQGKFTVKLPLPPFPPKTKLFLHVGRGPDNNGAWDLAFFTDIDATRGPYTLEQFPGFESLPERIDADICGPGHAGGRTVFLLFAPGEAIFNLTAEQTKVTFSAGILPGAFTAGGKTDGVEYQAIWRDSRGREHMLGKYHSNPLGNPDDRQERTFTVPLPPHQPGAKFVLRVTTGPHNSNAWDWSYVSHLRIE
ncbi:MAG: hypothetical protein C0518_00405 [Opitutus sp.]|nr:hypothetical protein [Opitutus sp.]